MSLDAIVALDRHDVIGHDMLRAVERRVIGREIALEGGKLGPLRARAKIDCDIFGRDPAEELSPLRIHRQAVRE